MLTENTTQNGSPAVSIIIPSYNTSQYIGEALKSVFAQTHTDYEVIVVNDGSPDTGELERVLDPYRDRLRYLKKENGGPSSARNAGIRLARGRYLAMLDSDDYLEPEYLAAQVATLEADPGAAVSYTNALIFGASPFAGKDYMSVLPSEGEVTFQRVVEQQCNVLGGAVVRREVVIRAGLYDETLLTAEDFDLWLRIVHQGGRIVYNRRPLWHYRKREEGLSADPERGWSNALRVLEKVRRTLSLSPEDLAVVDRRCAYVRAMMKLFEGKRAFFAGDVEAAVDSLTQANACLGSRKLALALWLLRLSPGLLLRAYDLRDRYIFRLNTKL